MDSQPASSSAGTQANVSTTPDDSYSSQPPLADPTSIQIELSEPSQPAPVAVGMGLGRSEVKRNEQVLLIVRAKMADGWHIYAADGSTGVGRPTKLELTLPDGCSIGGQWTLPEKTTKPSSMGIVGSYHHEAQFSIPISIDQDAPTGPAKIHCDFSYQSCTDSQCLRPTTTRLSVPIHIVSTK